MSRSERLRIIQRHVTGHDVRPHLFGETSSYHAHGYKYTVSDGALTEEQRQAYERDGFVVVRQLIPHDAIAVYEKRFQDICNGKVHIPGLLLMKDVSLAKNNQNSERVVNKIQDYILDEVSGYLVLLYT